MPGVILKGAALYFHLHMLIFLEDAVTLGSEEGKSRWFL